MIKRSYIKHVGLNDSPKILYKKGYVFEIPKIKTRVGNILTCLEHLILLAKNTESVARIGKFNNGGVLSLDNYTEFDFRSKSNDNCNLSIISSGNYMNNHPFHDVLFTDDNLWCLKYLRSLIIDCEPSEPFSENTLIIHVRSGDIFGKKFPHVHPDLYQPPLKYYEDIISKGGYNDILITTEHKHFNPVIEKLISKYNARLSSGYFLSDINLMLKASHFICSRSTLSYIVSRMNKNLKSVYYWADDNKSWREFLPKPGNCISSNVNITEYGSDKYIKFGGWVNSKKQKSLMLNFKDISINGQYSS